MRQCRHRDVEAPLWSTTRQVRYGGYYRCQFSSGDVAPQSEMECHAASIKRAKPSVARSSTMHAPNERATRSGNLSCKSVNTNRRLELPRCLRGTFSVTGRRRYALISDSAGFATPVHAIVRRLRSIELFMHVACYMHRIGFSINDHRNGHE